LILVIQEELDCVNVCLYIYTELWFMFKVGNEFLLYDT